MAGDEPAWGLMTREAGKWPEDGAWSLGLENMRQKSGPGPQSPWLLGGHGPLWAFDRSYRLSTQKNASAHTQFCLLFQGLVNTVKPIRGPQRTPTLQAPGSAPPPSRGAIRALDSSPGQEEKRKEGN